jgi:quinol-cytochrome oxidoreductase complex cytochrome b subunit
VGVDYRKQYRPDQLEPFWPNEIMKMGTAVLCTLAVIMAFAILPVVLDVIGLHGTVHTEEPADPYGTTPVGIKPEWYFLASYQVLKLMPTALLGVSGKTLGVVAQGVLMTLILLLPFWYRRAAHERPRWIWRIAVTAAIAAFVGLTIWGGWPAEHGEAGEHHVTLAAYLRGHAAFFIVIGIALLAFYALIAHERNMIRRTLRGPPPPPPGEGEEGP